MKSHEVCGRIRMCLSEVGLDPERMMCLDDGTCVVGCGTGTEGLPNEQIEALCERAIQLANGGQSVYQSDDRAAQIDVDGNDSPSTTG